MCGDGARLLPRADKPSQVESTRKIQRAENTPDAILRTAIPTPPSCAFSENGDLDQGSLHMSSRFRPDSGKLPGVLLELQPADM